MSKLDTLANPPAQDADCLDQIVEVVKDAEGDSISLSAIPATPSR